MKQVKKISESANYNAVSIGKLNELGEYKLVLGPNVELPGKVFLGNALQSTGSEMSFQMFAPGQETGFYHTHKNHEELYIFIKGSGEFQIDGQTFGVSEGSIVRVSPAGKRTVRNNGNEPLVMICVQYKANAFTAEDAADGDILNEKVVWE